MAYPSNLSLEEKLRSGHVRRWHIVAVAREQTVADHQYRTAVIAKAMLEAMNMFDWNSNRTINTMEWARIHDQPEAIIGDMPANSKAMHSPELAQAMFAVEAGIDSEWRELQECVHHPDGDPIAGLIVKVADLAEATNYIGIWGVGLHARQVWLQLRLAAYAAIDALVDYEDSVGQHRDALNKLIAPLLNSRQQHT